MTTPRPPLDRSALERVLSRAAELQGKQTDEPVGALSDDQIVDLGREVGLTPDVLRRAIAEERANLPMPEVRGAAGAWFGGETIVAARVVPGSPAVALDGLDKLFRGELPFDVKRRFPDGGQWEPKRGFLDTMKSQLSGPNLGSSLRIANEVTASVVPVDANQSHVRLTATLASVRSLAWNTSVVIGSFSTIAAVVLAGVIALNPLFVIPPIAAVAGGSLFGVRRGYHQNAARVATALEQVLDRLEFGPPEDRGSGFLKKLLG